MFKVYITFTILITISNCNTTQTTSSVREAGTLQKAMVTSYMYGTHQLYVNGKLKYALRSKNLNLDDYLNTEITIFGDPIEGYPIDFGPPFVNVVRIE